MHSQAGEHVEDENTQLVAIRQLMLQASGRGVWLTLAEIAEPTEFGEASISAQLRHLRKPCHGRYLVVKRRRRESFDANSLREPMAGPRIRWRGRWEYRVIPPAHTNTCEVDPGNTSAPVPAA